MQLTAHKTVTQFMRYVHTEDDPVRAPAEVVALRRRTMLEAANGAGVLVTDRAAEAAAAPATPSECGNDQNHVGLSASMTRRSRGSFAVNRIPLKVSDHRWP
jgi:hypothetical protein